MLLARCQPLLTPNVCLYRLAGLSPRPHSIRRKCPPPTLSGRHSPPPLYRTPFHHTGRRKPCNGRVIPRPLSVTFNRSPPLWHACIRASQTFGISNQPDACGTLPLPLLHCTFPFCFLLLKLDDESLEICFCRCGGRVMNRCPAVAITRQRIRSILQ